MLTAACYGRNECVKALAYAGADLHIPNLVRTIWVFLFVSFLLDLGDRADSQSQVSDPGNRTVSEHTVIYHSMKQCYS